MRELRWFEVLRGSVRIGNDVHEPGALFQERPEDRFGPLLDAGRIRVVEAPNAEMATEAAEAASLADAVSGESSVRPAKRRRSG